MRRQQSSNNTLGWLWVILMLTNSVPSIVFAEGNKEITPKNTHPKTYGSGWECNPGYHQNGKVCDAIKVPENAYLKNSSYGNGWECNWGYRKSDDGCIVMMIPANAYLDSYGNNWKCNRGFKTRNNTCVAIKIPENGFLINSTYGKHWECERGFVEKNNTCITLNVPVNAHIDYSGHDWDCNPPYTKRLNKCELSPRSNY
jgi:hypothetical protein